MALAAHSPGAEHGSHGLDRLRVNRVGLWLFFFSESVIFGLLLSTRFYLEGIEAAHLDQLLGLGITVLLLTSSITAYIAETAMARGNRALCSWMLLATIAQGLLFAGGVAYEWSAAEFTKDEAFGTAFFAMTGLHATHVISGVGMLALAWIMLVRGHFSPSSYWGIEGTVKYWHFVDVVWVFFYPALYLVQGVGGTTTH
ncbi:MAG: heme-copper oxidase subunit III [Dehalococcoidia bacterium]